MGFGSLTGVGRVSPGFQIGYASIDGARDAAHRTGAALVGIGTLVPDRASPASRCPALAG